MTAAIQTIEAPGQLRQFVLRRTWAIVRHAGDHVIVFTTQHLPRWNPMNVCSYHLQEAGATPVQELAFALANALDVGLGASVWASDPEEARAVAARMQSGTVWINSHGGLHPMIPFGGAKQSGYGREFGVAGLKAVAEPHVISG